VEVAVLVQLAQTLPVQPVTVETEETVFLPLSREMLFSMPVAVVAVVIQVVPVAQVEMAVAVRGQLTHPFHRRFLAQSGLVVVVEGQVTLPQQTPVQVVAVLLLSVLSLLIVVRALWLLLVELKQRSLVMVLMVIWVRTTRFILFFLMVRSRFLLPVKLMR
jgi:hypothetical protein